MTESDTALDAAEQDLIDLTNEQPGVEETPEPEQDDNGAIVWRTEKRQRPAYIVSVVDNGTLLIGWDTCGSCNVHIQRCACKDGPKQPYYIARWQEQGEKPKYYTEHAEKRAEQATQFLEPRVREVQQVLTPSGRKPRSDKGKPRGPRRPKEEIIAMAQNLADSMKEGTDD